MNWQMSLNWLLSYSLYCNCVLYSSCMQTASLKSLKTWAIIKLHNLVANVFNSLQCGMFRMIMLCKWLWKGGHCWPWREKYKRRENEMKSEWEKAAPETLDEPKSVYRSHPEQRSPMRQEKLALAYTVTPAIFYKFTHLNLKYTMCAN